jgi:error-prone DNA polymerase
MSAYAELAVTTNFSFLRGASKAEELVLQAKELGLLGLGIADRNSVAGVVRAHSMAKVIGFKMVVGARLVFSDGSPDILAYPADRDGWGRLTRLLTLGKDRAEKGDCILGLADLLEDAKGINFIVMPPRRIKPDALINLLTRLKEVSSRRSVWLAASVLYRGDDRRRLAKLTDVASSALVPLIAMNDVLYHEPQRRVLQDVVTCIREHLTLEQAGRILETNAERHLKSPEEMARLFREIPQAIGQTTRFLKRCRFSLDELEPRYPSEFRHGYATAHEALVALTEEGARKKYPDGLSREHRETLNKEFSVIQELDCAAYFLTVYDIVRFAKSKGILCQGRGSAANSLVCYCLGITAVSPERAGLLFERFMSVERQEPPDIDVDFEHERREEVIQHIYSHYKRRHAGMTATVISYRSRSAIRDVGKVFGLSKDTLDVLTSSIWGSSMEGVPEDRTMRAGLDPSDPRLNQVLTLSEELLEFPRHLSQHVGGFVISEARLDEIVPIENAAMEDRTVIEWDKDDLDTLKILKVDVLGLGMLSCLRRGLDLLKKYYGVERTLENIPEDEPAVYRMLSRADSIGVFQVESRAQMSMLPRLRPEKFYDLVIEVAIVRPGPIQGNMVHPYLRRKEGLEKVDYPAPDPKFGDKDELKKVLERTLGVPLFQEQAMQIAIACAGFTPVEASKLRRSMATFKRTGEVKHFKNRFIEGMCGRGYPKKFVEDCFRQIEGFGEYGFPESHAASFALLVYSSAWIKCHYPDVFAAALLNSQPMGFYAAAQLVRDAEEHGVEVRPVDVNLSDWDCTLEELKNEGDVPPPPLAGEGWGGGEAQAKKPNWHVSATQRDHARQLRKDSTGAERIIWSALRAHRLNEASFRRQDPIGPFIVDFVCHEEKLIVELDGGQHFEPEHMQHDARRDTFLTGKGYRVLRFNNHEVMTNRQGVIETIAEALQHAPSLTLPRERGRGRARIHPRHDSMRDDIQTTYALRLGFRQISGFSEEWGKKIESVREAGFDSVRDLWLRTGLPPKALETLAHADAFNSLGLNRRDALWAIKALRRAGDKDDLPLFARVTMAAIEPDAHLPSMPPGQQVIEDYRHLSLSLKAHPVSFLRPDLDARGILRHELLIDLPSGRRVTIAGLVLVRQRPGTGNAIFMTLEDETAVANIILWPRTFEKYRPVVMGARLVSVTGILQNEKGVIHIVADHLDDLTHLLRQLSEDSSREMMNSKQEPTLINQLALAANVQAVMPKGRNFH